jgi:cation diffusion facilitator CzcD-associated flavoprotein CzcO
MRVNGDGAAPHHRVAVVGAGFSGLGAAIRMRQAGIEDFVVLERADEVGGTWQANTYPGCQCDVASHLYSFSFMPNPDWSRGYSHQREIWNYLRRCADRGGVRPHLRLGCEVLEARWVEGDGRWRIETSAGPLTADVVIAGPGGLSEPSIPDFPGLESFAGPVFHSAAWDHDVDLRGKRVAVIGTGASAIQVVPSIQPDVARLDVFQRTPPWIVPHRDRPIGRLKRWLYRTFPPMQKLARAGVYMSREPLVLGLVHRPGLLRAVERIALRHMKRQVPDPELRRRLTPAYRIGCKRILPSNDWYPALGRDNVEVVSDGVAEVRPEGILDRAGNLHELDVIVMATGFKVMDLPIAERLRGREGTLAEAWRDRMEAYLGTTISGFPNLFLLVGPNTGLGHNSIVYMIESQLNYVLDGLRVMGERELASVEVRPEVQREFNADLQRRLRGTVWDSGGCASWYLDSRGCNRTIWPRQTWSFRRMTRRFDPASYRLEPAGLAMEGETLPVHPPALV